MQDQHGFDLVHPGRWFFFIVLRIFIFTSITPARQRRNGYRECLGQPGLNSSGPLETSDNSSRSLLLVEILVMMTGDVFLSASNIVSTASFSVGSDRDEPFESFSLTIYRARTRYGQCFGPTTSSSSTMAVSRFSDRISDWVIRIGEKSWK